MKKKLSFLALVTVGLFGNLQAQTTTWDFTANNPSWAVSGIAAVDGAPGTFVDSKGLGLFGIGSNGNFAAWNSSSSATWSGSNPYSGTYRVQMNGAGYGSGASDATPTQRYMFLQVDKACTVKVWFKSGSGGQKRGVIASDGTTVYGRASANDGNSTEGLPNDGQVLVVNITKAGTFYLYGDAAVNLYQIQVDGAVVSTSPVNTLAAVDIKQKSSAKVYALGNKVYLSDLAGKNTEVSVFSANGSLVKTLSTATDTNFELRNAGMYIVNLKSENGTKSVKVLVD